MMSLFCSVALESVFRRHDVYGQDLQHLIFIRGHFCTVPFGLHPLAKGYRRHRKPEASRSEKATRRFLNRETQVRVIRTHSTVSLRAVRYLRMSRKIQ